MKKFVAIHDHVLSPAECLSWVLETEAIGYEAAPVSTPLGAIHIPSLRNNDRVMFDDVDAADALWDRIHPLLPRDLDDVWKPVGLNERLRFYRYEPGQTFALHRDGCFARSKHERSFLTLLIYLNDADGGSTRVMTRDGMRTVAAEEGRLLLFGHRLLHEGTSVHTGRKYVLRSDVMFRRT